MSADAPPLVEQLRAAFAERTELAAVYLFGSVARGTSSTASDVDIAVLEAHEPTSTLAALHCELADELTERIGAPVEIVSLRRASLDLIHRVLADGVLLAETDHDARVRFEVAKRREYLDLKPYLDEYRRARTP